MLTLEVTCSNPGIIQIAKILKTVFQMIQIIGPILVMVSLGILFFRLMVFDYDERTNVNATKKYIDVKKRVRNALLALVITFFLPIFVNLVMSATFMKNTFQISACWKEVDSFKYGRGSYIPKKNNKNKETGTFIIDPSDYNGTNDDPNGKNSNDNSSNTNTYNNSDQKDLLSACETQAEWMKNYTYGYEKNPTVEKSKKKGTCVTYVACVLQRIGALKSGKVIWHDGKGYGTGKVYGTTSSMTTKYMDNKKLSSLKSELQAGDIILLDDNKRGVKGSGGHIFIFTGEWAKNGNPLIYDNESANNVKKGKSAKHEYSKNRKVLAIVRLS